MPILAAVSGFLILGIILWDAFETIILPRRVTRRLRLARLFYRSTWVPWSALARRIRPGKWREALLSFYGPLSLLLLFGVWALGLILSFAMLHWAAGSAINVSNETPTFGTDLYMSGTTFFTLGLGDVTPRTPLARAVTVVEAGTGFGFLAIVISYLPVLYGAFSRREVNISLLDARAGSPPTAAELLRRHAEEHNVDSLARFLHEWESWSAELMESHLSYPVLSYFRSQHNNQSWLAALTTILDACAVIISCGEGALRWQAQLTFAISRHAVVDLAQVLNVAPREPEIDRLPREKLTQLRAILQSAGVPICGAETAEQKLRQLRRMYEPYVSGLANRLVMPLPSWAVAAGTKDNWRTSAWEPNSTQLAASSLSKSSEGDEHF